MSIETSGVGRLQETHIAAPKSTRHEERASWTISTTSASSSVFPIRPMSAQSAWPPAPNTMSGKPWYKMVIALGALASKGLRRDRHCRVCICSVAKSCRNSRYV
jgi:hypothetical protein